MSPQRSRRRNAVAARLAAAVAVAGIAVGTLLMGPTASGASATQSTAATPSVGDAEPVSPYDLGVHRVSSAPGKSVYVTDEGDSVTVSFEDGEAGGPSAMIRTAGGGWVGTLTHTRTGPLTSPFSGCEFRLVDGTYPYVDIRLGTMTGRVDVPAVPPAKTPSRPEAATKDASTTRDASTTTTITPPNAPADQPAEQPNSPTPQPPSAHIDAQQRAMPRSPGATDGTNLILYAGGALIAAAAITGVALAVVRRDPDTHP